MPVAHEPWIVALSVLVAIQGSYVAIGLTLKIAGSVGLRRRLTLAAAAFTFAVSIWAMHFVGILALRVPVTLHYLVLPTLLSLLVSVFVVGVAVFLASLRAAYRWALPVSALVMGVGIATMHYIGMMALHGAVTMHHQPAYVVASFVVAVAASALGLRFAFAAPHALPTALAACVFGVAISGMHYVAMAGLTLAPAGDAMAGAPAALSPDLLAVIVAVVASAVSAVFLLTLVPDQAPHRDALSPAAPPAPADTPPPPPPPPHTSRALPVGRNGAAQPMPVEAIVYVQADTHYTWVFDGQTRRFCALSIGEVEKALDPARFLRVHRSYLIAVDRIAGLRRSGDGGIAALDTAEPATVPVSRARYRAVKSRIEAGRG